MATESKAATEEAKIDLFEDDDEFEEFEINQEQAIRRLLSATKEAPQLSSSRCTWRNLGKVSWQHYIFNI
ncbi:hypothetical protein Vadar_017621 [Vaccinium darrowii]|uniref:Uncharacterized protein n=1 Tax=Vaccinium darrowii TaxID=229202 RepID=A0ACB7YX94_9ERIC|nr:hypothetical protein Vadar_017621 [Vaccinium darrowii]